MPYRIREDENGQRYIEADTPEEALHLLSVTSNGHHSKNGATSAQPSIRDFFLAVNDNARKFMLQLAKHKNGVKGDAFAEETGFAVEKFGGILGGASKIADRCHVPMKKLVISKMRIEGASRYRFLQPGPLLLKHIEDLRKAVLEEIDLVK
jgi:hypothetical protein